MRPFTKACRWGSTGLIALALSGVLFLIVGLLFERYDLQERLGVDDDASWLAFVVGPVSLIPFHRRLHAGPGIPRVCAGLGCAGFVAAAVMFVRMGEAAKTHVPTGPLSGIGYGIMQLLSVCVGAVAFAAVLGGLLGIAAHRMKAADERAQSSKGALPNG